MTKRYSIEEIEKLLNEAIESDGDIRTTDDRKAEFIAAAPTIIRQLLAERNDYRETAISIHKFYGNTKNAERGVDAEARKIAGEGK